MLWNIARRSGYWLGQLPCKNIDCIMNKVITSEKCNLKYCKMIWCNLRMHWITRRCCSVVILTLTYYMYDLWQLMVHRVQCCNCKFKSTVDLCIFAINSKAIISNSLNCCTTQFKNTLPSHNYIILHIVLFNKIHCTYPNWVWCHWTKDRCWTLKLQCWCIKCIMKMGDSKRFYLH